MPSAVPYATVISPGAAMLNLTVKSIVPSPSSADTSSIRSDGVPPSSSSMIVADPLPSRMFAPDAELSTTVKDSRFSPTSSSSTDTLIVSSVSPAEKVSLPESAV